MPAENASRFLIGTCGYSYPEGPPKGWSGVFYPKRGGKRIAELEFYATYFNAVEINSTFYRPASRAMAKSWVDKTPEDFGFAVKVWQKFTHPTKLGEGAGEPKERWERFESADVGLFRQGIAPLADSGKLGALLFQYPASFRREKETLEGLERTLEAFEHYPKVVELRHHSWSDQLNETQHLLARSNTGWAYIDEPKFASSVSQELQTHGDLAYIRLHGRNYQKWWRHEDAWERYDYFYQPDNIRRLGEKLRRLAVESPTTKFYVFFNNHARGQAAANALMLKCVIEPGRETRAPKTLVEAFAELKEFVSGDDAGQLDLS